MDLGKIYDKVANIHYISEKFEKDKEIFNKMINILNIYMQRKDWPRCYTDFNEILKELINGDPSEICLYFILDKGEAVRKNELKEWYKEFSDEFKMEFYFFCKVVLAVIDEYNEYNQDPLEISNVVLIDKKGTNKLFRIERVDGCFIDLRMSEVSILSVINILEQCKDDSI